MQTIENRKREIAIIRNAAVVHARDEAIRPDHASAFGRAPLSTSVRGAPVCLPTTDLVGEIHQAICESPWREVRSVSCKVTRTHVVLTGNVTCFFMKQMAQETIKHKLRDRRVLNRITVAEPLLTRRKPR